MNNKSSNHIPVDGNVITQISAYLLSQLIMFCSNHPLSSLYDNKPKSYKYFTTEYLCNDRNSCVNKIEMSLMVPEKDTLNLLLTIHFHHTDYCDEGNISQVCLTRNVNDFLLYIKSKSFENELSEKIKSNMNIYISRK